MRLATTLEIRAGGQGSGCHGDNCGRHAKEAAAILTPKGYKKEDYQPLPDHKTVFHRQRMHIEERVHVWHHDGKWSYMTGHEDSPRKESEGDDTKSLKNYVDTKMDHRPRF